MRITRYRVLIASDTAEDSSALWSTRAPAGTGHTATLGAFAPPHPLAARHIASAMKPDSDLTAVNLLSDRKHTHEGQRHRPVSASGGAGVGAASREERAPAREGT